MWNINQTVQRRLRDEFRPPKAAFSRPLDCVAVRLRSQDRRTNRALPANTKNEVKWVNNKFLWYKIHGRATSSNVQPVVWLIDLLGMPFERLDVGGAFGGTQTPEYRAMNPNGLIPVLEDDDVILFESQAILRYVATQYGYPQIWPEDPAERAKVDMWMEWAKSSVATNVMYKVFWQSVRVPSAQRNHALVEEGVTTLKTLMQIAERQLEKHDYLVSDNFSLADITFGTQLFRYFELDFDKADCPRLRAYYNHLCTHETYQKNVMVSFESLRVE